MSKQGVNIVILEGNVSTDIFLNTTPNGKVNAFCRLAVDGRQEGQTRFFAVKSWGPGAEAFAKYCGKGSRILVEGQLDNYTKEGVEYTLVNFARITFLNTRKGNQAPDADDIAAGEDMADLVAHANAVVGDDTEGF